MRTSGSGFVFNVLKATLIFSLATFATASPQAAPKSRAKEMPTTVSAGKPIEIHYRTVKVDGLDIFYREAGPKRPLAMYCNT